MFYTSEFFCVNQYNLFLYLTTTHYISEGFLFCSSSTILFRNYRCCCLVTKLYLTLCDPMHCSLPGSSIHGIFQARIWSRLLSPSPGIFLIQGPNQHLLLGRWILYHWAIREALFRNGSLQMAIINDIGFLLQFFFKISVLLDTAFIHSQLWQMTYSCHIYKCCVKRCWQRTIFYFSNITKDIIILQCWNVVIDRAFYFWKLFTICWS